MKNKDFGIRLKRLREDRRMNQEQLAKACDYPPSMISHYERGDRLPGLESIKTLCAGLKCSSTELLGF